MSDEAEIMEQEIVKEENLESSGETPTDGPKKPKLELKKTTETLRTFSKHLKRPKSITIAVLFLTVILISVALNLLSKKNQEIITTSTESQTNLPSPEATASTSNENINQKVKSYTNKLNSLDNYQKELQKPIVDLDISFK